jgi:hypothetical protein
MVWIRTNAVLCLLGDFGDRLEMGKAVFVMLIRNRDQLEWSCETLWSSLGGVRI